MANPVVQRLLQKTGNSNLLDDLSSLPLSELNSLLMEVFRQKAASLSVKDVLKSYRTSRFVFPSDIDPVDFMALELSLLQQAKSHGFDVMELSPLAPLGSCSTFALADQNKIVSALRSTEVVADATNVLALDAAIKRIRSDFDERIIHTCAAHRHVRAQSFSAKGFSAHFKIFCMVSAGRDTGSFIFEYETLLKHLLLYSHFLSQLFEPSDVKIVLKRLHEEGAVNSANAEAGLPELMDALSKKGVSVSCIDVPLYEHRYYRVLRFSINVSYRNNEMNLGDGGFVDWPEKLTANRKERMLTSGLGTELLFKMLHGKL